LKHMPDQQALHRAFQEKNDTLKLEKIRVLYREGKLDEARPRAEAVLVDPDSSVEVKFWARIQLQGIDYHECVHAGRPQSELPKILFTHAKELQKLTASGPNYLKFYSLIARHSAELDILVHESLGVFMALHQHVHYGGDPMMVLGLYARRSVLTRRIAAKYNQCVRLARYAANYRDRWALGRALTNIVNAIAHYLVTLHSEGNLEAEQAFAQSALQICQLAAWIGDETSDAEGVVIAITSSLLIARSVDSDAYRWADQVAHGLADPDVRKEAFRMMGRAVRRWRGEPVEGDYHGNTIWQVIQNMAAPLGIDLTDENDPLVRGLMIAARDDSPERVLSQCEHLLVSVGAIGPNARLIQQLFNIGTASSKVVHCTLHGFHVEGKELDTVYEEFRQAHCDSCPDRKPRPEGWRYTDEVRQAHQARHQEFVMRLAGTPHGTRYTNED